MEHLILQQLQAEIQAQALESRAYADIQTLDLVSPQAASGIYDQASKGLSQAEDLRQGIIKRTRNKAVFDSLIHLYYALEKSGIIRDQD